MTRPRTTAGKRNVQQLKREKAQAKQERRAARRATPETSSVSVEATEAELLEDLATLHRSLEAGELSPQLFEERREGIRTQLEHIARLGQR